ncbi:MAG: ABC transporter ATP-binding protein [Hyphomicrobiales bacterium]
MTAQPASKTFNAPTNRALWATARELLGKIFFHEIPTGARLRFALTVVLAVIGSVLSALAPVFFGRAVDAFNHGDGFDGAIRLALMSVGLWGMAMLLREQIWFVYQPALNRVLNAVRSRYLRHILALPLSFHTNRSIGRLDSIFAQGIGGLQSLSDLAFTDLAPMLFELIAILSVIATLLSAPIALCVIVSLALYGVALVIGAERTSRRLGSAIDTRILAQGQCGDAILNAEGIKTLAAEDMIATRYDQALDTSHRRFVQFFHSRGILGIILSAILICGFAAAIALAGFDLAAGRVSVGKLVVLNSYLLHLFRSVGGLSFSYRGARQSFTVLVRFIALFAQAPESKGGDRPIPESVGEIVFTDVGFVYPDGRRGLERTSLTLEKGRMTALLGPSGSGKTTLIRLLLKFYPLREGKIAIDGADLSQIETGSLRRAIAVVPQDLTVFRVSFAFNIALEDKPDMKRLNHAVAAAQLAALVARLPEGLDSELGERGYTLSMGERQRLAIARALYRDPTILILDEATSALDENTRDAILPIIGKIGRDYLTLVVTHDPAVAEIADRTLRLSPPVHRPERNEQSDRRSDMSPLVHS